MFKGWVIEPLRSPLGQDLKARHSRGNPGQRFEGQRCNSVASDFHGSLIPFVEGRDFVFVLIEQIFQRGTRHDIELHEGFADIEVTRGALMSKRLEL